MDMYNRRPIYNEVKKWPFHQKKKIKQGLELKK